MTSLEFNLGEFNNIRIVSEERVDLFSVIYPVVAMVLRYDFLRLKEGLMMVSHNHVLSLPISNKKR